MRQPENSFQNPEFPKIARARQTQNTGITSNNARGDKRAQAPRKLKHPEAGPLFLTLWSKCAEGPLFHSFWFLTRGKAPGKTPGSPNSAPKPPPWGQPGPEGRAPRPNPAPGTRAPRPEPGRLGHESRRLGPNKTKAPTSTQAVPRVLLKSPPLGSP